MNEYFLNAESRRMDKNISRKKSSFQISLNGNLFLQNTIYKILSLKHNLNRIENDFKDPFSIYFSF